MSNSDNVNVPIESTNEVPETPLAELNINQLLQTEIDEVNNGMDEVFDEEQEDQQMQPPQQIQTIEATGETVKERPHYEVVFFVRYGVNPRPSLEELTNLFNRYGEVHHINCPQDKNFAFVFMSKLSTDVEHRRTRVTISQIIKDMTPETRFHITVASSNRNPQVNHSSQVTMPQNSQTTGRTIRYPSARYRVQRPSYDTENTRPQFNRQIRLNSEFRGHNNGQDRPLNNRRPATYNADMFTFVRNTENGEIRRPSRNNGSNNGRL